MLFLGHGWTHTTTLSISCDHWCEAPLFRQMGIYEDFLAIAKHQNHLNIMDENLKPQWTLNYDWLEDM